MKKIFSLIADETADSSTAVPEEIEILSPDASGSLFDVIKQAKGKYTVLCEGDVTCDLTDELYAGIGGANADILSFGGGHCFKTSILKGLNAKLCADYFTAQFYAALSAKNIEVLENFKPFEFAAAKAVYTEDDEGRLFEALEEFKKAKPKLSKEVYSFASDLLCAKLKGFYAGALVLIYEGKLGYEKLAEFDGKLKEDIVLYHTFDKRFSAVNLAKLREKKFKIGLFTYLKLKK